MTPGTAAIVMSALSEKRQRLEIAQGRAPTTEDVARVAAMIERHDAAVAEVRAMVRDA